MRILREPRIRISAVAVLAAASIALGTGPAAAAKPKAAAGLTAASGPLAARSVAAAGPAVGNGNPKAGLSIDPASTALTVKFVAQSGGFPAPVVSYHWTFGDGASVTTTAHTVTHTYLSASVFMPSVTETDSHGATATATATLSLSECSSGSTCTESLTDVGTVQLLQVTGPVNASAPPAEVNLLVGRFRFPGCDDAIQAAVAATDTRFTGNLTLTLRYITSHPSQEETTCFSSTVSFVDAAGATVHSGALPMCQPGNSAPCVESIRVSGQQVTKSLLIPPGDPKVGGP